MNKEQLTDTLRNGICELVMMDEHSVETAIMATLAPQHLSDDDTIETLDVLVEKPSHTIVVFNVNSEKWESYPIHSVVSIEQLTGEGADANESKLQASPEYLEQLSLFSSGDDLDTMEHPEDL
jgi:hypothetical protein